jgi:hypothetical protein
MLRSAIVSHIALVLIMTNVVTATQIVTMITGCLGVHTASTRVH